MIDLHCHLDLIPKPFEVSSECRRQKLYVLSVTTTPSAWPLSRRLSQQGDRIRVALGLHPEIAHERKHELVLFDEFLPQTRYVGEVGLDGRPELTPHQADQKFVFEHVLGSCAKAGGRILSIHSRRAAGAVLDAIAANPTAGRCILHWFSGSKEELRRAVDLGCWFSVGPTMLNSKRGQCLAAMMPMDRLLTETDAPFASLGNRVLMPWDVSQAEGQLAQLWRIPVLETQQRLRQNLSALVTP